MLNTGASLGNIAYDVSTHTFYVSNLDNGKIYHLSSTGATLNTWDHGANLPTPVLDNASQMFTQLGRRVWGVQTFQSRLYYGVWWEDTGRPSATKANEVWSVGLDSAGNFLGLPNLEVSLPPWVNISGQIQAYSNPVSDISFGPNGTMLVAERGMSSDTVTFPHQSRVLEYQWNGTTWIPSSNTFGIGNLSTKTNAAGGVDYDFSPGGRVWATGDALLLGNPLNLAVYGLQGIPASGGTFANSFEIDLDGNLTINDKNEIGDVELPRPAFDFGNYVPVEFHGIKFEDKNGNGVQDPGELGLAGWIITITGTDGMGNPVNITTTTMADDPATEADETGMYWVLGLKPGTYTVEEQQQSGWIASTGSGGYTGTFPSGSGSVPPLGTPLDTELTLISIPSAAVHLAS